MSDHADTIRRTIPDCRCAVHRPVHEALDALLAERQQAIDALRGTEKLAAAILGHEGHDDVLVCLEEAIGIARSIQTVSRAALLELGEQP